MNKNKIITFIILIALFLLVIIFSFYYFKFGERINSPDLKIEQDSMVSNVGSVFANENGEINSAETDVNEIFSSLVKDSKEKKQEQTIPTETLPENEVLKDETNKDYQKTNPTCSDFKTIPSAQYCQIIPEGLSQDMCVKCKS